MTTEEKLFSPGEHLKTVREEVNRLFADAGRKDVTVSYDHKSATWRFTTSKRIEYKTTRLDIEVAEVLDIYERLEKGEWVASYIPPKSPAGSQQSVGIGNGPVDEGKSFIHRVIDTGKQKFTRGHVQEPQRKSRWSQDILDRAELVDITKAEIRADGAYRGIYEGETFWFPLDILVEEEEGNERITDNDEFFEFFDALVEKHNLKQKKSVSWDHQNEGNYLSKWWKNDWGFSSGPGSELAKRLAIALGVINTTIQVVNDNPDVRWRVELASAQGDGDGSETPVNYTNFEEKRVVVSPQALLDTSIDEDQQIEVTTGYSLHEASHVQYTGEVADEIRLPTVLRPLAVSGLLMNVLEDVRIESLTAAKYPGFANYFVTMHEYLWKLGAGMYPRKWGPLLNNKLNTIIAICKWSEKYEPLLIAEKAFTPDMEAEFVWFKAWADDYVQERVGMRESLEQALAHLAEDPSTKSEMEQQGKNEAANEKKMGQLIEHLNSQEFRDALSEALQEMNDAKTYAQDKVKDSCPSPNQPNGQPATLNAETAQQVDQFVHAEVRVDNIPLPARFSDKSGYVQPTVEVTKPEIHIAERAKPSPLLARLKAAFVFRKARPMYSTRQLQSGTIDEELLANTAYGDFKVFEQRTIESDPDTQVTMLIDCSGSMSGSNLDLASELAHVMLTCLKTMKGVRVRVRAHTSEIRADQYPNGGKWGNTTLGGGTINMFRVWEPGDDENRVFNMNDLPSAANYDGFAIAWAADEMLKEVRQGEDMVLIVLSDGRPAGHAYGGQPAMEHVRQVTDYYEKQGVTCIQIAVDRGVGAHEQSIMFKHFIAFDTREKLPTQLTNMLIKLFS